MNNVQLIGRLTKDPEVRYTGEQMAVAKFSLAIDRYMGAGKEKQTDFIRIVAFGKTAENCEKHLSKGLKVAVEGSIKTGSYDHKDGYKVYTTEVIASRVEFLEWAETKQTSADDSWQPTDTQGYSPTDSFTMVSEDVPF